VYPYGASMTVQAPALPLLSSGPISYPLNRPIAGVWEKGAENTVGKDVAKDVESSSRGPGRLLVMASTEVFGDDWLEKEENGKLCDVLVRWLLDEGSIKLQRQVSSTHTECSYTDALIAYDRVSVLLLLMTTVAVVLWQ
jgi:intraflagellar transport protein 52